MSNDFVEKQFGEVGAWARHYSTVRLTLATFLFTMSTYLIVARWDRPELLSLVISVFVWLLAQWSFAWFSWKKTRDMQYQNLLRDALLGTLGHGKFDTLRRGAFYEAYRYFGSGDYKKDPLFWLVPATIVPFSVGWLCYVDRVYGWSLCICSWSAPLAPKLPEIFH